MVQLECHGVRSYPSRAQNVAGNLNFEDVVQPSVTGVVTYTASNLVSNCTYTCRLKSVGKGGETDAYEEVDFTTADGREREVVAFVLFFKTKTLSVIF